jgi:hypothetical protein
MNANLMPPVTVKEPLISVIPLDDNSPEKLQKDAMKDAKSKPASIEIDRLYEVQEYEKKENLTTKFLRKSHITKSDLGIALLNVNNNLLIKFIKEQTLSEDKTQVVNKCLHTQK